MCSYDYIPTMDEMKEMYQSYLGEIEMFDGQWGLDKAMSFEAWVEDQEAYGYYAWSPL